MARHTLLLVRHGKAQDRHPDGDGARGLTAEGRVEFRDHAQRLTKEATINAIATSPLVRAVQTAEILADACAIDRIEVRSELAADSATPDVLVALARELGAGWALVGHNPSLAETLARLAGRPGVPRFRKGAAAAFVPSVTEDVWELIWVAAPGRKLER